MIRTAPFLFALLVTFAFPALSQPLKRSEYKPSIAAIYAENVRFDGGIEKSSGTGYIISEDGHILTALHVVGDAELYEQMRVEVYFTKRTDILEWNSVGPYSAKIKAVLPEYDLALLSLEDISYASTLPVFGFYFVTEVDDDTPLSGYAFNLLGKPADIGQPALVKGFVSRDTSPVAPFFEAGSDNVNAGSSGGPIFETGDRIMAMWHGVIASFRAGTGEAVHSVNGMAWIIPMSNKVKDWLTANNVSPRLVAAQRAAPVATGPRESYTVYVSPGALRQTRPEDPSTSQLFTKAPVGTEIVGATLLKDVTTFHCHLMKCSAHTVTEVVRQLPISEGQIALLGGDVDASTRIQLHVQSKPQFPEFDIRYVRRDALFGQAGSSNGGRLEASPGKTIIAAAYVSAGSPFNLKRAAQIEDNAVVAKPRAQRMLDIRDSKPKPPLAVGEVAIDEPDQIAILEADTSDDAMAMIGELWEIRGSKNPLGDDSTLKAARNVILNEASLKNIE